MPLERPQLSLALQHGAELGLSVKQGKTLRQLVDRFGKDSSQRVRDIETAERELAGLLKQEPADLAQVDDKVRAIEKLRADLRLRGSALLGLLQLGASQGLAEDELYREALAFNSFWFARNYIYNAVYMKAVKAEEWGKVDAKALMGSGFSSASGNARIQAEVAKIPNLIPKQKGEGESCSI